MNLCFAMKMAEYINKTTAYEVRKKMEEEHNLSFSKEAYNKAAIMISTMPTEDVQPVKHGKWLICTDGYYPYCSECRNEPKSGIMTKYCPECGTRMDKE